MPFWWAMEYDGAFSEDLCGDDESGEKVAEENPLVDRVRAKLELSALFYYTVCFYALSTILWQESFDNVSFFDNEAAEQLQIIIQVT
ncbi:hypothetical protein N7451_011802 [Penicillium sp. IBT 35674x]|nr:hypothetical protein N7451_011802 [Penicillium sp. IBT 35674x]